MRKSPTSRSALLLAVAGMVAIAAGGAAAGAPLCPAASGQAPCPMAAASPAGQADSAGHATSAGHGCHSGAALAADCCRGGEAAVVSTSSVVGIAPPPAVASATAAVSAPGSTGPCHLLRAPARPPAAGLFTLHRAFLI